MIREKDFAATKDRDGKPKPADTCPFCKGKLITDRSKAIPDRTVIRRVNKPKSDKQHLEIGFHLWNPKDRMIKDTPHPGKLPLPCCGTKDQILRLKYDVFKPFRDLKSIASAKPVEEEKEEPVSVSAVDFTVKILALHTDYILGNEKFPLYMGKFAVVPPTFDKYFAQKSENIVQRTAIRQEVKYNGIGFLRVGVENSINESLLAVIAPLLNRSYISEVKALILEKVIPRVFLHANFGNLVHEFYSPSDEQPTDNELRRWASKYLQVDVRAENRFAILRVYLSFQRFKDFIKDTSKPKDLRHIAPLLAEPGLFAPRGIQLVVLDWNPMRPDDPVTVRCPAYGIAFDRHKMADFAFVSRSIQSIGNKCGSSNLNALYELFVHTENKPGGGEYSDTHISTIQWQYINRSEWPQIVQTRIDEFLDQCKARITSLYTSQSGINSESLITLSKAISTMAPQGIIRDSYNHAVALTFKTREKGISPLVALPIVDDGRFFGLQLRIHMDWEDFIKAPVEEH